MCKKSDWAVETDLEQVNVVMSRIICFVFLITGCSTVVVRTPFAPDKIPEVDYVLLDQRTGGSACEREENLKNIRSVSNDKFFVGHGFLYEKAKLAAIKSVNADGLLNVVAITTWQNNKRCVELTGRPYIIVQKGMADKLYEKYCKPRNSRKQGVLIPEEEIFENVQ